MGTEPLVVRARGAEAPGCAAGGGPLQRTAGSPCGLSRPDYRF